MSEEEEDICEGNDGEKYGEENGCSEGWRVVVEPVVSRSLRTIVSWTRLTSDDFKRSVCECRYEGRHGDEEASGATDTMGVNRFDALSSQDHSYD